MTAEKRQKPRLDEILIKKGLISEAQIKEALMRQKAHGGKFGSQLLYHRYIDEAGLVKALATQFHCEGVVLSKLNIPEPVIKLIPKKVAVARKVVPFDYDSEDNVLKIACEDPTDQSLINELNFVARGKDIKLYIAAELALNTAIAKYYLDRDVSLDDHLLLEIPDEATETGKLETTSSEETPPEVDGCRGEILLVTDEEYCGPLLQSILERDNYRVTVTDSADDAIDLIGDKQFDSVFIKDTVPGDYLDLIDRLRKISPRTAVRYYPNASSLVLNKNASSTEGELLVKGFDLLTSLLSSKYKLQTNHGGIVGHYVNKLCRKLGLPDRERFIITSAAYLHDLAKFYYSPENTRDPRSTIKLSAKLLESLNFSPVVIGILRSMYIDLGGKYTKRLPIEALGGNILTIVDLFCENISLNDRLSLDKFDAVKKKLRDLSGKLFLHEVVEAFIILIQEEILQLQTVGKASQVMIYSRESDLLYPVEMRLKHEGFRTVTGCSWDSFTELYQRSRPDMMVLLLPGEAEVVNACVDELKSHNINYKQTPTFLLVDTAALSELTGLLGKGIEDIIALDGNLDLLMVKMHKVRERIQAEEQAQSAEKRTGGSQGWLADMNLIDLLQALGPSRKTVRITITPGNDADSSLVLYLDHGNIIFAQCRDILGAEAVYEGIAWTDGTWTVEPVTKENLPQPNNELSNESILMEGCRLLDEKVKAGQLL
jgi:DNA-binding response OmpR family regulator